MTDPLRVDGDEREDEATAVGLTIAGIYQTVELALLAALTTAVRRALPLGAVTIAAPKRLRADTAAILVKAEQRAQRAVEAAGVPYDYQPVIPVPASDIHGETVTPDVTPGPTAAAKTAPFLPAREPASPPAEPLPAPTAMNSTAQTSGTLRPLPIPTPGAGQMTGPSIRDMIESVSVRVYRSIPDIYQQAVQQAI